jgi:hypothetical protein
MFLVFAVRAVKFRGLITQTVFRKVYIHLLFDITTTKYL